MSSPDDLWRRAAEQIRLARGWLLQPAAELGRPREHRRTWLAEGAPGVVIVKLRADAFAEDRAAWSATALALLRERGYPVPETLWRGPVDEHWFGLVQTQLPGTQLSALGRSELDALLALVELQAEPGLTVDGSWDVSSWMAAVLFEGWEHWWECAEASAPETASRLRAYLQPASGHRLPTTDLVHGDLNLTNVLVHEERISGVVDWDDVGLGSRALDLTSLLFGWKRLQLAGGTVEPSGRDRLVGRILEIAGENGLRCTVSYGAIARLALTAQRGERGQLAAWRRATDALLDELA